MSEICGWRECPIHDKLQLLIEERTGRFFEGLRYNDDNLQALEKLINSRFAALDSETRLVAVSLEKRINEINKFRESNQDALEVIKHYATTLVTRAEWAQNHDAVRADIQQLRSFKDTLTGVATQKSVTGAYLIASGALLAEFFDMLLRLVR